MQDLHVFAIPVQAAAWLPDGSGLLLAGLDGESLLGQIWFVSYPQGEVRRFSNDLSDYELCCLEITRDGRSLLALRDTRLSEVWLAKGDGSDPQQITSSQNLGFDLLWLGSQLAATNLQSQWFGIALKGGPIAPLFNDHEFRFQMSACPQGNRIVYDTVRNSNVELWSSDDDGANAVKITDKPTFAGGVCGPDAKSVLYANQDGVWRSPLAGGTPEKTDSPRAFLGFSPDGQLMFYTSQEVANGAMRARFVITPANRPQTVLHSLESPYGFRNPRFSPDGQAIAMLLNRNRASNIWEVPLSGSAPFPVTKFTTGHMFSYSWSKDGKQLAFSRGQIKTDVILMSNFR